MQKSLKFAIAIACSLFCVNRVLHGQEEKPVQSKPAAPKVDGAKPTTPPKPKAEGTKEAPADKSTDKKKAPDQKESRPKKIDRENYNPFKTTDYIRSKVAVPGSPGGGGLKGLPKLRRAAYVLDAKGEFIASLEIDGKDIFHVRIGDELNVQGEEHTFFMKIKDITDKKVEVQVDFLEYVTPAGGGVSEVNEPEKKVISPRYTMHVR